MVTTRSSLNRSSNPTASADTAAGSKRKASTSKEGQSDNKKQKTIDETIGAQNGAGAVDHDVEKDGNEDADMMDASEQQEFSKGEESLKQEAQKEETPREETPKEEIQKEEPPKEQNQKEELPKEENKKEEPLKEEVSKEEAAKEEPLREEAPREELPKEEIQKEEPPKEEVSEEESTKEEPTKQELPKEEPPKEEIQKEEPPREEIQKEYAPTEPSAQSKENEKPMTDDNIPPEVQDTKAEDTNDKENGTTKEADTTSKEEQAPKEETSAPKDEPSTDSNTAVEESSKREETTPSNILEKGIIYFFFRGRVNIEDPNSVSDIARSYMILRPLPHGAKLTDGPIGDGGSARLLALPKKVLPKSHHDRFMSFVEKSGTTFQDLKDNFMAANEYETKTAGTRQTPAATPVGEGVYAITTTGQDSGRNAHLAYILTIPSELGEVQKDLGLRERGSFIASVRNPKYDGPANTQLPKGADYPPDLQDSFRTLRWQPLDPAFLNYEHAQILLIGEEQGEIEKAGQRDHNTGADEVAPKQEMEKLEREDELRVEHMKGNESDAVFRDLGLNAEGYKGVATTW